MPSEILRALARGSVVEGSTRTRGEEPPKKIQRLPTQTYDGCEPAAGSSGECPIQRLAAWPQDVLSMQDRVLSATGARSRLEHHCSGQGGTIYVTSSYSGIGTFEFCIARLAALFTTLDDSRFKFWSACESDASVRAMLMQSQACPEHVFGDICERVEKDCLARLQFIVKSCEERAANIAASKQKAEDKKKAYAELSDRCMRKLISVSMEGVAKQSPQTPRTAYCYKHEKECPLLPPCMSAEDLLLEGAGNTCVAFSPQGKQAKWIHPSGPVAAIWASWAACHADMIFQECSHLFDTKPFMHCACPPDEGWSTSVVTLGAVDVGVPMIRPRNFSWTVRTHKLRMVAPLTKELFYQLHPCPPVLSGHKFFVLDAVDAASFVGGSDKGRAVKDFGFEAGLASGMQARLQDYKALYLKQLTAGQTVPKPIVDLSQNAGVRGKLSDRFPSLLTQSLIWSFEAERMLTPPETFLLMGWPCMSEDFPFGPDFFTKFSNRDVAKVMGNSFHCRLTGLLLAAALALTDVRALKFH